MAHSDPYYGTGQGDGKSYIYTTACHNQTYVGQARYRRSGDKLLEVDINFNMRYPFAIGAVENNFDLLSVFTHEVGHGAGLKDDQTSTVAVMYKTMSRNKVKRIFTPIERRYLKDLYN